MVNRGTGYPTNPPKPMLRLWWAIQGDCGLVKDLTVLYYFFLFFLHKAVLGLAMTSKVYIDSKSLKTNKLYPLLFTRVRISVMQY